MAAIAITYDLPTAEQVEEYARWALDTVKNVHLKQPGLVEVRAYRDPLLNSPQVLVLYEFDTLDSAVQYMNSDVYARIHKEAQQKGCKNLTARLLNTSPVLREPARPSS
jgi:heme-degrading monooxygenase HmoA